MPEPSTLETRKQRLITALSHRRGEWFKRADLAEFIGVKSLSEGDRLLLELLIQCGEVESREVDTYAPSGKRFEYRIKEG